MRFQLPQFIETEVKIVGPFTLKQFLWIAGGASVIFLLFILIRGVFFFMLAIPIGAVFLALAFLRINGLPLINYFAFVLAYLINPKKFVFKNEPAPGISLPVQGVEQK